MRQIINYSPTSSASSQSWYLIKDLTIANYGTTTSYFFNEDDHLLNYNNFQGPFFNFNTLALGFNPEISYLPLYFSSKDFCKDMLLDGTFTFYQTDRDFEFKYSYFSLSSYIFYEELFFENSRQLSIKDLFYPTFVVLKQKRFYHSTVDINWVDFFSSGS